MSSTENNDCECEEDTRPPSDGAADILVRREPPGTYVAGDGPSEGGVAFFIRSEASQSWNDGILVSLEGLGHIVSEGAVCIEAWTPSVSELLPPGWQRIPPEEVLWYQGPDGWSARSPEHAWEIHRERDNINGALADVLFGKTGDTAEPGANDGAALLSSAEAEQLQAALASEAPEAVAEWHERTGHEAPTLLAQHLEIGRLRRQLQLRRDTPPERDES